eukprot:CAMPEP_0113293980 /NCGR_PEP_ID=MMETSP0008_2-20120614/35647_1 /TAXON_ID=97485 /ORGANISM="Prymnesium parvum" /LENGTH=95 /DNA_ID=CAMNT_0000146547 /DNA_START=395 /DNA_END=682 /DNA_ORIENTATION=+ /assembly_acc=CAM_ASM_000153
MGRAGVQSDLLPPADDRTRAIADLREKRAHLRRLGGPLLLCRIIQEGEGPTAVLAIVFQLPRERLNGSPVDEPRIDHEDERVRRRAEHLLHVRRI